MKFEVGTVVQLRSGGPMMTVTGYSQTGSVVCQWFWNNKMEVGSFPAEALQREVGSEE